MPQYAPMREDVPAGARPVRQPQGYTFWMIGDERAVLRDAYHTFLRMPWAGSLLLIAAGFVAVNLVFATIYTAIGGVDNVRPGSFWDALVFSVETLATIGYGVMNPKSDAARIVMIVEAIVSVIVMALATGLVFTKFARPTARVAYSSRAVIAVHDRTPTLMFRVGNRRSNTIVQAQVRVSCAMTTTTAEGRPFYKLHDLTLVRDRITGLRRGWVIMHVVDDKSPLHGLDAAALAKAEVELEVSIVGLDDITTQTVHTSHVYTDKDIALGHRFVDMMHALPDGDMVLDLRNFDATEPDRATA